MSLEKLELELLQLSQLETDNSSFQNLIAERKTRLLIEKNRILSVPIVKENTIYRKKELAKQATVIAQIKKEFPQYQTQLNNFRTLLPLPGLQDRFIKLYQEAGSDRLLKELLICHSFDILPS